MRIHRSLLTELLALAASAVAVLGFFGCESPPEGENTNPPASISEMLSQIRESEILATATDLQNFGTRVVGYQGNVNAAEYIHQRLTSMSELTVTYQGGDLRNVVATLPGTDGASDKVYIVGAHYDSASSTPTISPGATDNACGVGIVLELARIMSTQRFKHDLKFAAWNGEETGPSGSAAYTYEAVTNNENIELYVNYDSAAYDPEGRLILDIIYNDASLQFAEMMEQGNSRYGIGFAVTHNVHLSCASDHKVFWTRGFCSVTTHSEQHAPGTHSPNDTVDKISTAYAKKNGQVGMAVLAELAELITAR
jgi:Zn-dependent M28 family amino/carboxypeptidase